MSLSSNPATPRTRSPRALVPEPRIAGCVFVHVPRTAGSSIWQSMARLADVHQIPVFDIYRESNVRYGIPEASDRVLEESVEPLATTRFFFHHHTAENIFRHFKPGESVFATVLRDPVDRFVSDVYHYRRFIRSTEPDSPFAVHTARFWSARFTNCLRRDDVDPRELLDLGAAEDFFRNYYVNFLRRCAGARRVPEESRTFPEGTDRVICSTCPGKCDIDFRSLVISRTSSRPSQASSRHSDFPRPRNSSS